AAETFKDPQWKASALYRAEDYAAAAEQFAQGDTAEDFYNLGNALSKAGQLEKGIATYDEALKRQPDFRQAEENRELVRKLLEQQEQEKENEKQQDQSNDEKNSDQENKSDQQDQQDGEQNPDQQDQQSDDQSSDGENQQG